MIDLSDLIARIRRGEIGALEALYRCEAPRLIALAAHLTADRAAAEDVVHEVFCALWRDPDAVGHEVREYLVASAARLARARRTRKRTVSDVKTRKRTASDVRSRFE